MKAEIIDGFYWFTSKAREMAENIKIMNNDSRRNNRSLSYKTCNCKQKTHNFYNYFSNFTEFVLYQESSKDMLQNNQP